MSWLFGARKTPADLLRENKRMLDKAIRELDRERTGLQAQEKKLIAEIKRVAKQNQMAAVRLMAKDLIRTRNSVTKFYALKSQLQGVSLRCETGRITTIIGPNGCGKSTLLKAIIGLVQPTAGRVVLHDVDVTGRAPEDLLRLGVAMLPQVRSVFPRMTCDENVLLGGYLIRDRDLLHARVEEVFALFPALQKQRVRELTESRDAYC